MVEHEQTLVETEKRVIITALNRNGVSGIDCPKCEKSFEGRLK